MRKDLETIELNKNIKEYKTKYEETLSSMSKKYKKIEYFASIMALDLNKDIIGFFYNTIEKKYSTEELCIRTYGFLQAMFVSIDAIYSLSMSLTNSKNFVNINDNPTLRELKYIRNDVVGHPTNRIVARDVVYCVLKPTDISKYSFKYHIYNMDNEEIREVSFLRMLYDYYLESYKLLDILLNYQEVHKTNSFSDDLYYIVTKYKEGVAINALFRQFRTEYKKQYTQNSRIYKRINLITKVNRLPHTKLNNFAYLFHLNYLYENLCNLERTDVKPIDLKPYPDEINEVIKFFKENYQYKPMLDTLQNHNYPGFREALNRMINLTKKEKFSYARMYFEEIRLRISKSMYDEAYALLALLKLVK
ncbi:MAG: hypothetical protein K6G28_01365 [Acholeplasmatales bacterium]|nr:hypothetical protein [Acholeplasmatales bacterium]